MLMRFSTCYHGTYLTFTVPFTGTYTIECWGASGGNNETTYNTYGRGSYVAGDIDLSQDEVLYIYIGQRGSTSNYTVAWNGGGQKGAETSDGGGGGATDVRTKKGLNDSQLSSWGTAWDNTYGLRGRIIVAAGGGGSDDWEKTFSGDAANRIYYSSGGGLFAPSIQTSRGKNTGATQTSQGIYVNTPVSGSTTAGFGKGNQDGYSSFCGGGSGYWGGPGSDVCGMGGSCYISGHPGCIAIANASGTAATTAGDDNSVARATHYSGLKFSHTVMIDGSGYEWTTYRVSAKIMPTPPGGSISYGNVGHGYCRITGTSTVP